MNAKRETRNAEHKFFCDAMLGRLAKWLRLLGYDTAYQSEIADGELLTRCRQEGRVLLTRDTHLVERRPVTRGEVGALLLTANGWREQLEEVADRWPLTLQPPRCPVDNGELEDLERESARSRVPEYVWVTQKSFHRCPACRRIYWQATQWQRIASLRDRYR